MLTGIRSAIDITPVQEDEFRMLGVSAKQARRSEA